MKIVVYEHFTSGALQGQALPADLAREGDAMLQTIVEDMLANTTFMPIILRDKRLADLPGAINLPIDNASDYQQVWQQCLHNERLFLLIAPETDGVLQQLAETVLNAGKTLLGSQPDSIAICADKWRCSQFLQQHDLPAVATQLASDWLDKQSIISPLICKPIDGAGCVDTYYFADSKQAVTYLQNLPVDKRRQQIIQPFINANAMSLSLFIDQSAQILSLNQQHIAIDKQFAYLGSDIDMIYPANFSQAQAQLLVDKLTWALPGLSGFVGIDILVDDQEVWIVDINPRLTSSFNQLKSTGLSPANLLYQSLSPANPDSACG